LNIRAAILASAAVLIASYVLLLGLFRRYHGRLTPLSVLTIGVVWFSLADVQNALWAFQIGWFLVLFGFTAMLFSLLVPRSHRRFWYSMAIVAAVIATLGTIQGFVVWPLGAIAMLWCRRRSQRRSRELIGWAIAFLTTVIVYFIGYDSSASSCAQVFGCVKTNALAVPATSFQYSLALLGNVVPGHYLPNAPSNVVPFELLGALILIASLFVIVRSCQRRTRERLPLPLLLIVFALLFDAAVTWGRVGEGVSGAIHNNRYVMPSLVLLAGLLMYTWVHIQELKSPLLRNATALFVGAFLLAQIVIATNVGIESAAYTHTLLTNEARVVVNFDSIPLADRGCEEFRYLVLASPSEIAEVRQDALSEFSSSDYGALRQVGPPRGYLSCNQR